MEGEERLLEEWASSGKAPTIEETDLPDTPLMKEYMDQFDSITNKLHDTKSFHDNRDVSQLILEEDKLQGMMNSNQSYPFL